MSALIGIAPLVAKDHTTGETYPLVGIQTIQPGMTVRSYNVREGVVGPEKIVFDTETDEFGTRVEFVQLSAATTVIDGYVRGSVICYVRG